MTEGITTIKVPRSVRERVAQRASEEHRTAAEVISALLDQDDRRRRFEAVRAAYTDVDDDYRTETAEWDALAEPPRPA